MAGKDGSNRGKFPSLLILLQGLLLILFVVFVDYSPETLPDAKNRDIVDSKFPVFQDVHSLVVVGFGLLMIFLKKYGFSGVGYTFLIAAITMQWAVMMHGFMNMKNDKIHLGLDSLITGDLAALTVIITFGAILGKTSNLQLLVIAFFEVIYYIVNRNICTKYLQAVDPGGSMYIHMFGAFFGVMVAKMLYNKNAVAHYNEMTRYTSDVIAAVGTLFIWVYWPSLNIILVDDTLRYLAIVNTYCAMSASCVMAFAFSSLVTKGSKLSMVHIQNATLAGGVTVGSIAAMIIQPWGAILIGVVGGTISTLGYKYVQPFLIKKLHIHDTCGVSSLHGLPGIVGGIASVICSGLATYDRYHTSLYVAFPARAPILNSTQYFDLVQFVPHAPSGSGRSAGNQAGFQLGALVVTLGIAIIGGLITGFIARQPFLDPLTESNTFYTDQHFWEVPQEYTHAHSNSITTCTVPLRQQSETLLMPEQTADLTENTLLPSQNHVHLETIT